MGTQDPTPDTDSFELDPDEDGVGAFVDQFVVEEQDSTVPKKALYLAYASWAKDHGLDYTNDVWFGRKLSDRIAVESDRQRRDGERITVHTGIAFSESGERLLEEATNQFIYG
ncbi:primase-like DNA-binding domain-containing protein [Halostagnicola bangensis]